MEIKACTVSGIRGRTEAFSSQENISVTAVSFIWFYRVKNILTCNIHIQQTFCNTENFPCAFSLCFQLSSRYKFEPYVVGLNQDSSMVYVPCVPKLMLLLQCYSHLLEHQMVAAATALDVEAQEACGRVSMLDDPKLGNYMQ